MYCLLNMAKIIIRLRHVFERKHVNYYMWFWRMNNILVVYLLPIFWQKINR